MGLFSRTSKAEIESEDFDEADLPTSTDIDDNPFTEVGAALDFNLGQKPAATKLAYGIEDAIRLMKALPRDNNEVVVTVVKRTLESTSIEVQDIIDDATAKEEKIREQQKTLEGEIKNLQGEIAKRNQRISELLQNLKDTTDVRQRLQLALELDTRKNKTAENAKSNQIKSAETSQDASAKRQIPDTNPTDAAKNSGAATVKSTAEDRPTPATRETGRTPR